MQKPFPLKLKAFGHVEMLYTKGLETLEMNNLSMYLWAICDVFVISTCELILLECFDIISTLLLLF